MEQDCLLRSAPPPWVPRLRPEEWERGPPVWAPSLRPADWERRNGVSLLYPDCKGEDVDSETLAGAKPRVTPEQTPMLTTSPSEQACTFADVAATNGTEASEMGSRRRTWWSKKTSQVGGSENDSAVANGARSRPCTPKDARPTSCEHTDGAAVARSLPPEQRPRDVIVNPPSTARDLGGKAGCRRTWSGGLRVMEMPSEHQAAHRTTSNGGSAFTAPGRSPRMGATMPPRPPKSSNSLQQSAHKDEEPQRSRHPGGQESMVKEQRGRELRRAGFGGRRQAGEGTAATIVKSASVEQPSRAGATAQKLGRPNVTTVSKRCWTKMSAEVQTARSYSPLHSGLHPSFESDAQEHRSCERLGPLIPQAEQAVRSYDAGVDDANDKTQEDGLEPATSQPSPAKLGGRHGSRSQPKQGTSRQQARHKATWTPLQRRPRESKESSACDQSPGEAGELDLSKLYGNDDVLSPRPGTADQSTCASVVSEAGPVDATQLVGVGVWAGDPAVCGVGLEYPDEKAPMEEIVQLTPVVQTAEHAAEQHSGCNGSLEGTAALYPNQPCLSPLFSSKLSAPSRQFVKVPNALPPRPLGKPPGPLPPQSLAKASFPSSKGAAAPPKATLVASQVRARIDSPCSAPVLGRQPFEALSAAGGVHGGEPLAHDEETRKSQDDEGTHRSAVIEETKDPATEQLRSCADNSDVVPVLPEKPSSSAQLSLELVRRPRPPVKGKPPPPPPPKSKAMPEKSKAPNPPLASSSAPSLKQTHGSADSGAAVASAIPKWSSKAPFGKRLHWVKPLYTEPERDTVFSSDTGAEDFDPDLLTAVLGSQAASGSTSKRISFRKQRGICVLDSTRAQLIGIALKGLRTQPEVLASRLGSLDFAQPDLHAEDVELLVGKLPTPEEAQRVLQHAGSGQELRDVEQRIVPLCMLPEAGKRLEVAQIALTHSAQHARLLSQFETLQAAASEALSSQRLHETLRMVLKIANYINYGSDEGAKAFSVKSLSAFASFKIGNASALHCLCLNLCSPDFVRGLESDLESVPRAARESMKSLKQDLEAFRRSKRFVESQLPALAAPPADGRFTSVPQEASDAVESRLTTLLAALHDELDTLERARERAEALGEEAQRFLGDLSESLLQSEEFFDCLSEFIKLLVSTSTDVEQWAPRSQ